MPDTDDWRIDHTGIGVSNIGQSANGGVGYGAAFPIFWIDVFHAHGAKQHTVFRARSREEVRAFHRPQYLPVG